MAKSASKARGKFLDEKYLGPEPVLDNPSNVELVKAYSWFNYFYTSEDAKAFVLTYLRQIKYDKKKIKLVEKIRPDLLHNIGWNCRMVSNGSNLPDDVLATVKTKLDALIETESHKVVEETDEVAPKVVVSIQERISNKASELIGDLEEQVDIILLQGKNDFDPISWMKAKDIKPQIAQKIVDYYKPLYSEIYDALQGRDEQLKEAYSSWKKPKLKTYLEFIGNIVSSAESRTVVVRTSKKPRKKKEKPASVIVSKMKYKLEDTELNIKSVKAADIIGCQQLWVFNTKNRNLFVYNAVGPSGLNVKGTTIIGFDEKTSVAKKLRKPSVTVPQLIDAGKVTLRKVMENLTSKPKEANGRINSDMVLLRIVK